MAEQPSPEPSEKGLEVLRAIIEHVEQHGYQPIHTELAQQFGVTKNAIQGRLRELARRGLVDVPIGEGARERAVGLKFIRFVAHGPAPSPEVAPLINAIVQHVERYGYQPSQVELAEALGLSQSAIQYRLRRMALAGTVDMPTDQSRERAIGLPLVRFRAMASQEE